MAERALHATIHLDEGEVALVTFLATTHGVHVDPQPILGTLDLEDQCAVMRDIARQLRHAAEQLEARAGLAEPDDDIEEAMKP